MITHENRRKIFINYLSLLKHADQEPKASKYKITTTTTEGDDLYQA